MVIGMSASILSSTRRCSTRTARAATVGDGVAAQLMAADRAHRLAMRVAGEVEPHMALGDMRRCAGLERDRYGRATAAPGCTLACW